MWGLVSTNKIGPLAIIDMMMHIMHAWVCYALSMAKTNLAPSTHLPPPYVFLTSWICKAWLSVEANEHMFKPQLKGR
jgi:hypothetical protein